MASNFVICINAVLPLFLTMMVGMFITWRGFLTQAEVSRVNRAVFRVMFPFMMFYNIYSIEDGAGAGFRFIATSVGLVLAALALSALIIPRITKENRDRGVIIQAIFRSNILIMAIPVIRNIFGEEGAATATIAVAIIIPIYNVLAVIVLETFRGEKFELMPVLKGVVTNPLILGCIAGFIVSVLGIKLPGVVESVAGGLSSAASTMALVLLGASLDLKKLRDERGKMMIAAVGKLIVYPALGIPVCIALGFRGIELVTLLLIMGAPTATSSFTMAESMGGNGKLAASCVVFSSLVSCFTLFLWLLLLKTMGMF